MDKDKMASDLLKKLFGSNDTSPPVEGVSDLPEAVVAPEQPSTSFITPLVGVAEGAQQWVEGCSSGQSLLLMREPSHPTDPNSISVWVQGDSGPQKIGYIHEAVNDDLAAKMAQGHLVEACVSLLAGIAQDTPTVLAIEVKITPIA